LCLKFPLIYSRCVLGKVSLSANQILVQGLSSKNRPYVLYEKSYLYRYFTHNQSSFKVVYRLQMPKSSVTDHTIFIRLLLDIISTNCWQILLLLLLLKSKMTILKRWL
jgi:hypothetical protein